MKAVSCHLRRRTPNPCASRSSDPTRKCDFAGRGTRAWILMTQRSGSCEISVDGVQTSRVTTTGARKSMDLFAVKMQGARECRKRNTWLIDALRRMKTKPRIAVTSDWQRAQEVNRQARVELFGSTLSDYPYDYWFLPLLHYCWSLDALTFSNVLNTEWRLVKQAP